MKPLALWKNDFYSPLSGFTELSKEIDRVFKNDVAFSPAVDVEEDESKFTLTFDLPGVSKDDVKIEIHENRLSVSGERRWETKENTKTRHFIERAYGQFARSFTLPATVEADKVNAAYNNGVLTITIPKAEESKPRQVKIS